MHPLHQFFHTKFTISDLKSKYIIFCPNYLTAIELRPPVSDSSTRISKFYNPTDSERRLHETRIENWLSIGFELDSPPWLGNYSHANYTMLSFSMMGSLKVLYRPIFKVDCYSPGDLSLPLNCASALKIHTQRPE